MSKDCKEVLPSCARDFGEIKANQVEMKEDLKRISSAFLGNGDTKNSIVSRVVRLETFAWIMGAGILFIPPVINLIIKYIK